MKATRPFSIRARCRSVGCALQGARQFFLREHNAVLHLVATIVAFALGLILSITKEEWIILVLVTGLVWTAELFNTAIEALADMISPGKHPQIKFIKDIAAAAVLIMATVALVCGLLIFIPRI